MTQNILKDLDVDLSVFQHPGVIFEARLQLIFGSFWQKDQKNTGSNPTKGLN